MNEQGKSAPSVEGIKEERREFSQQEAYDILVDQFLKENKHVITAACGKRHL